LAVAAGTGRRRGGKEATEDDGVRKKREGGRRERGMSSREEEWVGQSERKMCICGKGAQKSTTDT